MDAASSLGQLLSSKGHATEVVYSSRDALSKLKSFTPDVALIDLGLPEMNSYELAGRVQADPALCRVTLIAVTGYGQPEDRARSRAAGFCAHLVKPVDFAALESSLAGASLAKRQD